MKIAAYLVPAALMAGALASPWIPSASAQAPMRGQITWSGDVDNTVIVDIHGSSVRTRTISGKGAINVSTQDVGFLPHRPVRVRLRDWRGRGEVRVVQQPRMGNDYTAEVLVRDPQSGRGHYRFTLSWGERFRGAMGRFRLR